MYCQNEKSCIICRQKQPTLYENGKESNVPVDHIRPGDVVVLRADEKVPVDGQVIKGTIDESLLPEKVCPLKKYRKCSICRDHESKGILNVKVTKRKTETTLSQIIRIVEEAQLSKAPIQHIADKITEVFVPIVITIAMVTFAVLYYFSTRLCIWSFGKSYCSLNHCLSLRSWIGHPYFCYGWKWASLTVRTSFQRRKVS